MPRPTLTRREALRRTAALLGVALSPSTVRTALAQAAADPSPPRHLSAPRFAAARAMAEALLPRTDTPGAIDAGAPAFIDTGYGRFMTPGERDRLEALLDFAAAAGFPAAPLAAQQQALRDYGADGHPHRAGLRHFRELAIVGTFTSELFCKEVLVYDPVPGRHEPDIPLAETGGRAWAE